MRFALCLSMVLLCGGAGAVNSPMRLHYMEQPPLSGQDEKGQPAGRLVERLQRVATQGDLQLRWQATPLTRSLQELKDNQEPLCVLGVFRTAEREHFVRFSRVFEPGRPQRLVARASVADQLQRMPNARAAVLGSGLRFLVVDGVSYGDEIDAWIRERQGPVVRSITGGARVVAMLSNQRADFAIMAALGFEAAHAASEDSAEPLVLIKTLILPPPPARYIACSHKVSPDWMRALDRAIQATETKP